MCLKDLNNLFTLSSAISFRTGWAEADGRRDGGRNGLCAGALLRARGTRGVRARRMAVGRVRAVRSPKRVQCANGHCTQIPEGKK